MKYISSSAVILASLFAPLLAEDDYHQYEFPPRPAPEWVQMVDQGVLDRQLAGLMVPGLLVSLGTMLLFKALGWSSAWYFSGLGVQFIWTLPFGFLIMIAVFNQFATDLEEAARDLGANKWRTFTRVTLPIIAPGILGAGLFGFTFSYDEFARTIFVSGANNTLPLHIYAKMTVEIEPILYALGTASTVFSWIIILLFLYSSNRLSERTKVRE